MQEGVGLEGEWSASSTRGREDSCPHLCASWGWDASAVTWEVCPPHPGGESQVIAGEASVPRGLLS